MPKATDAELERRVSTVYRLMLRGASREAILQYAAKKEWGVETRSVDGYIARAKTLLRKQADADREDELGKARARLNLLFGMALKMGDLRTALAVQRELNALGDLYPAEEATLKRLLSQSGLSGIALILELLQALDENGMNGQRVFTNMLTILQEKEKAK